jgi:hypothetical protein
MAHSIPRRAAVLAACIALTAACSSDPVAQASGSTTVRSEGSIPSGSLPPGIHPGYPTDTDQISPLLISALAPEPIAFLATDGKYHLAYELQVINASPRPATLTSVETIADDVGGAVVHTVDSDELAERTLLVGSDAGEVTNVIPAGRVGLILLDGAYDTRADVPAQFTHRISATFVASPDDSRVSKFYPTEATQFGGDVITSAQEPVTVGPPLAGEGWVTVGSCCELPGHRGFMMPLGGRMNGTERFGLDLIRVDLRADPIMTEDDLASYIGDPASNASYLAFGQPALAVADATVVDVRSHVPDHDPNGFTEGLDINDTTGNYVVLDLGDGMRAMSNHLKQGSATVKVGDEVSKGQVIGLVGNAGNTTQPHLHFQIYRGHAPLSGDNVPFVIEQLDVLGQLTTSGVTEPFPAGPRTNQYPLANTLMSFPPAT